MYNEGIYCTGAGGVVPLNSASQLSAPQFSDRRESPILEMGSSSAKTKLQDWLGNVISLVTHALKSALAGQP